MEKREEKRSIGKIRLGQDRLSKIQTLFLGIMKKTEYTKQYVRLGKSGSGKFKFNYVKNKLGIFRYDEEKRGKEDNR